MLEVKENKKQKLNLILFQLWIYNGSANANYFFAITLVSYSTVEQSFYEKVNEQGLILSNLSIL